MRWASHTYPGSLAWSLSAIGCARCRGAPDRRCAGAPAAIGPYSHAVRAGGLLFCSGQIPLDPASGELVGETPAEQARRCLESLAEVCVAAGTTLQRAVRLTIYTTELGAFAEINDAYAAFFASDRRARAAAWRRCRRARWSVDATAAAGACVRSTRVVAL